MKAEYPITISATLNMITEFQGCEYGYHEDWQHAQDTYSEEDRKKYYPESITVYGILDRHTNKIEIRDADELWEVYVALITGTFTQGDLDKKQQARNIAQANRWIEKLRPALDAEKIIEKYKETVSRY